MPTPEEKVQESVDALHAAARQIIVAVERPVGVIDELEILATAKTSSLGVPNRRGYNRQTAGWSGGRVHDA